LHEVAAIDQLLAHTAKFFGQTRLTGQFRRSHVDLRFDFSECAEFDRTGFSPQWENDAAEETDCRSRKRFGGVVENRNRKSRYQRLLSLLKTPSLLFRRERGA
jgi:hypothetical protein